MVPDRRQGGQQMAKEYVLAIDQGTTSTRAMLFRHNGTVAGVSQEEHEQIYPRAGWVEHDPKEIWDRTKQVTASVLADANLTYENIAAVGITDPWVIWNLTGGVNGGQHITDYTNASRTMLFNLENTDWDEPLMERLGVPRSMLPELRPSSDRDFYGQTTSDGVLGGEVPVCGDAGDQQAALFGQACFDFGQAKNTYGTGNFLLQNTGNTPIPSKSGLLTTGFYALERGNSFYALEGSIAITGAAVQWLRDNLKMIASADETEEIAKSVEDSGGAYFVPAFSGLFAPFWDEKARGAIVGLTRFVNRAHLVRATLESMCYQSRDVAEAVAQDSGKPLPDLRVDGGAVKNDFLMQLQADILGIPVIRPQVQETTALGAAYLAGLATGYWSSLDEMRDNWQVDRVFEPTWSEDRRESGYHEWRKAIERTRGWIE